MVRAFMWESNYPEDSTIKAASLRQNGCRILSASNYHSQADEGRLGLCTEKVSEKDKKGQGRQDSQGALPQVGHSLWV